MVTLTIGEQLFFQAREFALFGAVKTLSGVPTIAPGVHGGGLAILTTRGLD
jgi:hypothetical protein